MRTLNNCVWMKFLYWEGDLAWFRRATWWEILKMKFHDLYTNKPDENNLLLWMPPGKTKPIAAYKEGRRLWNE